MQELSTNWWAEIITMKPLAKLPEGFAEYLRNTNLEELDPEGIQRDLTKLLDNPKEGGFFG